MEAICPGGPQSTQFVAIIFRPRMCININRPFSAASKFKKNGFTLKLLQNSRHLKLKKNISWTDVLGHPVKRDGKSCRTKREMIGRRWHIWKGWARKRKARKRERQKKVEKWKETKQGYFACQF